MDAGYACLSFLGKLATKCSPELAPSGRMAQTGLIGGQLSAVWLFEALTVMSLVSGTVVWLQNIRRRW